MKRIFLTLLLLSVVGLLSAYETTTQPTDEFPKIKLIGFARVRYTLDMLKDKVDGFTIATARFGITGDIAKYFTYTFSIEATNADPENKKLVYDAYIDTSIIKNFKIRAGQFKYVFGLEQSTPDADLELVNKAEVISNLVKPTRDIGLQVGREFKFAGVNAAATLGLVNGSGSNAEDENNRKIYVGRLTVNPLAGLTVGGSFYEGSIAASNDKKSRAGFELKLEFQRWLFKSEYVFGKDKSTKKNGYYLTLGYTVRPATVVLVRFDNYDSDSSLADKDISRWTFAVNYFFARNVLLRVNYEHKIEKPGVRNDQMTAQIQVKY